MITLIALGALLSVVFVGLISLLVSLWSGMTAGGGYNWKPDISSKLVDPNNLDQNRTIPIRFDEPNLTVIAKTEEQLHDERHAYLRERKL